jgi:hypothetical protein
MFSTLATHPSWKFTLAGPEAEVVEDEDDEQALNAVPAASNDTPPTPDRKARRETDEAMREAFLGAENATAEGVVRDGRQRSLV